MVVIGTRPEAIKLVPIIKELKKVVTVETIVCLTAQQREMLDQVLKIFKINPDIDLNLMKHNQSLSEMTTSILIQMDKVLKQTNPDWVLVQGDTTTVMATALAAFYNQIRIGHVEAGLRSFNKWAPFPEEINRKIAGIVTDLHFCPTELAKENLIREGFPPEICHVTGNTVIDALQQAVQLPFNLEKSKLKDIPFGSKEVITVTTHRRKNFGEPLENICKTILQISEIYKERVHVVYPVHLNPNVQNIVHSILGKQSNISLLTPLDYLSMVQLLKKSKVLLTDSGGLQEEAPGLGIPVLVLRDVTERPEGIASGNVKLVGANPKIIFQQVSLLLDNPQEWEKMSKAKNPYGDGSASKKIMDLLLIKKK